MAALTAIDAERVDWRDVSVAAALLSYVLRDAAGALFRDASAQSEPPVAEILEGFAQKPVLTLEDWGYRDAATADSRAFLEDQGERYEPETDLITVSLSIAAVIEDDVYRVSSIGMGTSFRRYGCRTETRRRSRALSSL